MWPFDIARRRREAEHQAEEERIRRQNQRLARRDDTSDSGIMSNLLHPLNPLNPVGVLRQDDTDCHSSSYDSSSSYSSSSSDSDSSSSSD